MGKKLVNHAPYKKVWAAKNHHQGIHAYFSERQLAHNYVSQKINNSYGSCWAWDCWKIKEILLDPVLEDEMEEGM